MRRALIDRRTRETQIRVRLGIEGRGRYAITTGIRFLDHMLELATRHGAFDLIHAQFVRDVQPGEIVIIDRHGLRSIQAFPEQERRAPGAVSAGGASKIQQCGRSR